MSETLLAYGSAFVLLTGFLCGLLTIALFISPPWVVDTLGLAGFAVYFVWSILCAVLSLSFDLIGNAKQLVR